jgi:hypothetical protein
MKHPERLRFGSILFSEVAEHRNHMDTATNQKAGSHNGLETWPSLQALFALSF